MISFVASLYLISVVISLIWGSLIIPDVFGIRNNYFVDFSAWVVRVIQTIYTASVVTINITVEKGIFQDLK